GLDGTDEQLQKLFSWLNLVLSIPVIAYSASDYFISAARSFRQKQINIDVPIALGLLALFLRSTFDIVTGFGPGYLDSFTGLVFFLLIGRWFQGRTYDALSFERDYKSYFPLAVQRKDGDKLLPTVIYNLRKGDEIRIRNLEIVPADSKLIDNIAYIDYSFVTGESRPVKAASGDLVYAGGRLIGQPARFLVEKETTQSHLTSLWNKEAFQKKHESRYRKIIDRSARIFTWIVMGIALITGIYWYVSEPSQTWLVLTSVLMVACPCALALAAPFTYGSMLRAFGRNNFYVKNSDVIERLAVIDAVVFDKTGTITHDSVPGITFNGDMTDDEFAAVGLLTGCSTHPLSAILHKAIRQKTRNEILNFNEWPSKGIAGTVNGVHYKIGSAVFTGFRLPVHTNSAQVFVSINDDVKGYFLIQTSVRENIGPMLTRLGKRCRAMLSGDNDSDRAMMEKIFPKNTELRFNLQPLEKMEFVAALQNGNQKVLMVGDGLNDAGALKQADVGLAVAEDAGLFTPGSDGILQGNQVHNLDKFLSLARSSTRILKTAFAISFMYNAIALTFAVTGHLTPLVAAILMPVSSVSVVGFSTIAVNTITKLKLRSE
ncbi:MAG TPA: HAD-IC family P-type ATPase, partial [Cyclobacteriaceae bacterium]|nr:HAD-IC family P-type ATPase [Cyclobacteriaceae bacterium]